jgi:hypothetical protein
VWLLKEYGPICAYCGETFPPKVLTLDHVTPRRGRSAYDRRDNLVLACKDCNGRKADKPFLAWIIGNKARARHLYVNGQHLSVGIVEILAPMVGTDFVMPAKPKPVKPVAPRPVFGPDDEDVSPYAEDDPYRREPARTTGKRLPRTETRASSRHGLGVCALEPIAAHQAVVQYAGELISAAQAKKRYPSKKGSTVPEHTFVLQFDAKRVVDANVGGNEGRYVNHSCDPNVEPIAVGNEMWLFALRDIMAGEELGYDYAIELDERHTPAAKARYPCACGATNCRGTLLRAKSAKPPAEVVETRRVVAERIEALLAGDE